MTVVAMAARTVPLALDAGLKEEALPVIIFFAMFFAVFGLGGLIVRHLLRKKGSMLDEILNERWEQDDMDEPAGQAECEQSVSETSAASPEPHDPSSAE